MAIRLNISIELELSSDEELLILTESSFEHNTKRDIEEYFDPVAPFALAANEAINTLLKTGELFERAEELAPMSKRIFEEQGDINAEDDTKTAP